MIPDTVLQLINQKLESFTHGSVTLEVLKHDNHCRFNITEKISFVPDVPMSGSVHGKPGKAGASHSQGGGVSEITGNSASVSNFEGVKHE